MATRPILTCLDPLLRKASAPVERIDGDLERLIADMLETMYAAPGIGLAAVQVGVPRRLIVCDVDRDDDADGADAAAPHPRVLINPEILWQSDERSIYNEGCLSVPEHYAEVERPARCRLRYLDHQGRPAEIEADGLLATCLQHEVDHLDGILFIDHLSRLKRNMIIRKMAKAGRDTVMV